MQLREGDGARLDSGRVVRIGSIYDLYTAYDVEEQVGHDPETHVRYSRRWIDGRIIYAETDSLDDFLDRVEEHIPPEELPDEKLS